MSEHLSDLVLDALRIAGANVEGANVESADRTHLATCPICQARKKELDDRAAAFARSFDVAALADETLAKQGRGGVVRWLRPAAHGLRPVTAGLAAAAAAAIIAVVLFRPDVHRDVNPAAHPDVHRDLRTKGNAPLAELFVLDGDARRAFDGIVPRDARLAVHLAPTGHREVRLLWGSGSNAETNAKTNAETHPAPERWSALYPEEAAPAWTVDRPAWLEREVILDGAKETEHLGVVACEAPLSHREAIEALELEHREGCAIQTIEVKKR